MTLGSVNETKEKWGVKALRMFARNVAFIEKDSKRFPDTHGWAYADFINDPATDTLTPDGSAPQNGTGATCGYACHRTAAATDYIFTAYPKR